MSVFVNVHQRASQRLFSTKFRSLLADVSVSPAGVYGPTHIRINRFFFLSAFRNKSQHLNGFLKMEEVSLTGGVSVWIKVICILIHKHCWTFRTVYVRFTEDKSPVSRNESAFGTDHLCKLHSQQLCFCFFGVFFGLFCMSSYHLLAFMIHTQASSFKSSYGIYKATLTMQRQSFWRRTLSSVVVQQRGISDDVMVWFWSGSVLAEKQTSS